MSRVSHQSRLSVNYDDNEMIPRAIHRSLGIYLTAEENPQIGDCLMNGVQPVIASNQVPRLASVGSHNTSGKEKEGKDESSICPAVHGAAGFF